MFQGKNVVVTGAGRGIGRAIALRFAQEGARVLVHYAHAQQGAEEVCRHIIASGGRAEAIRADLSNEQEIAQLVFEVQRRMKTIDVWINNAGASANSTETRGMHEVELFKRLMAVDVLGTWQCSRQIAPYMCDGGSLLTLGWDGALDGATGLQSQLYAMSKGAILSLTRCLAKEYAPRLRVNCIVPGHIENEWSQSLSATTHQKMIQHVPLQRWGRAEEIASMAVFLASPAASFITGQLFVVNGGEVMR